MHGIVSMEHFSDDAVRDPATRALMTRVHSAPDPAAKRETNDHFYCRLKITTTAGETFEHFVDRPVGRDRDHPLPPGALEAKFRDCAKTVLDGKAVETVLAQCRCARDDPGHVRHCHRHRDRRDSAGDRDAQPRLCMT